MPFNVMVLQDAFCLMAVAASVKVQLARGARCAGFAAAEATNVARKKLKDGMMTNTSMCQRVSQLQRRNFPTDKLCGMCKHKSTQPSTPFIRIVSWQDFPASNYTTLR
jgi:hypothetical protein